MLSKTIFVAFVAQLIVTIVSGKSTGRIVGGFPISINQASYQASMQYTEARKSRTAHFCGGSIISENYIVTAGHCVEGLKVKDFIVLVGTSLVNSGGKKIGVERIISHKNYNRRTQDYDIALVELSEKLIFNDSVQAIALPNDNETVSVGTMCLVSGWGDQKQFMVLRKTGLRAAEVPVVNYTQCNTNYRMYGGITPRMICAGFENGGKDACQGDSGGPLACPLKVQNGNPFAGFDTKENGVLAGIVSWGHDCAGPNYPGVYADVRELRGWIREKTGL